MFCVYKVCIPKCIRYVFVSHPGYMGVYVLNGLYTEVHIVPFLSLIPRYLCGTMFLTNEVVDYFDAY